MNTIFLNSKNSKTSDPNQLFALSNLSNLSIYYTQKNVKKSYKNNTFKISPPTWNEEFYLPDG